MAEKVTYEKILADIRAGRISPVYVLSGEESYYLDRLSEALQRHVLSEEEADFNQDIFYGADADLGAVLTVARQYPVFAERRLVMLKEAQTLPRAKSALEASKTYMEKPSPTTVLVIVYKGESLPLTSKWIKAAAASGGVIFTSPKIRDYQLPGVIKNYCKSSGVDIDEKSIGILSEYIGTDLSRLFGEIEKLRQSVPPGSRLHLTPELIERNIGISKEFNNYELASAVLMKNYAKAMRITRYFGSNQKDNPVPMTTSVLFNTFVRLLRAHYMKDKSENALRTKLGLFSVTALKETGMGLRNYSAGSCVRIIREIRRFDAASKGVGSMQPVEGLMQDLIYKIFTS